jgi:hypothetical protein
VAKPNYAFEKRQRELAKKKKKEEKSQRKASGADGDNPNDAADQLGGAPGEEPAADSNPAPQPG